MPHVTIEYSAPLADTHDMQTLCGDIFAALSAHDAIPDPTSLKIRAIPCKNWKTGSLPDTFAHAQLELLPGRNCATKSDLAKTILAVLTDAMPEVGSLSVDVTELSEAYAKRVL